MDVCKSNFSAGGRTITVAGYKLEFPAGQLEPYVYIDYNFCDLYKAFEIGLISKADVYNIGEKADADISGKP